MELVSSHLQDLLKTFPRGRKETRNPLPISLASRSLGCLKMAVSRKLSYVVVVDYDKEKEDNGAGGVCQHPRATYSSSYTLTDLQSMLQLAGCKANHAYKISRRVFDLLEKEHKNSTLEAPVKENAATTARVLPRESENYFRNVKESNIQISEDVDGVFSSKNKLFDLYKRNAMAIVKREKFLDVICDSLTQYHYVGPSQRSDILLACRLREKRNSITVLLCGTSGCGKSTLSALLGSRLGITTVVSTDSIRHMMRSFVDEKDNPLLWASTYHAGEYLDPTSVAQAKAKRKDGKMISVPAIGSKVMAVEGYKAQSEMVMDSLDKLITTWEDHKESVIVEGVHLSLNFVCDANSVSSKCMFKIIQRQGSSRRLMAIVNSDGSVSKAWPFSSSNGDGTCNSTNCSNKTVEGPLYGPLQIGLSEPVNVQFGNFGIGSWPNDMEGTSYASSLNGSKVDGDESTQYSSCSSSPICSEGHAKDLIEELTVSESEEEVFPDTDDSSSEQDPQELCEDEFDGSVIESSTRSDEELDDDELSEILNSDGFRINMKSSTSQRTLSRTASGRPARERRVYNRSISLPVLKNHPASLKKAKTFKMSLDVNVRTTN
ncbi:P-loop NTPase domain-containing LPA1-like protein 1 [Nymphaea thermarum]|nr:P-loop NTPase domain-containing LPA1-like protein 1 [Nymphaea thermarum]